MLSTAEMFSLVSINVVVITTIFGTSWKIFQEIKRVADTGEEKRGRIYKRLDEVKKAAKEDFTDKNVCDVRHEQITRDLTEIKTDVKILIKNGIK